MPASADQKLRALFARAHRVKKRAESVEKLILKILESVHDEDIGPTMTTENKLDALGRYLNLRKSVLGIDTHKYPGDVNIATFLPDDFVTWEPNPSEYENPMPT
jgi:hypothetical protein